MLSRTYQVLTSPYNQDSLKVEALKLAKDADVVLFVGGLSKSHLQDSEGDDRKQFHLPFGQNELLNDILKLNSNVGFISLSGNAFEMPWRSNVKGIMQCWYLGSMAGNAIADVISGEVNPSGKLPFTFPKQLTDNGAHYYGVESYPGLDLTAHYKEDILVGYRWHDTKNIAPEFAFGFGLSYTSFELSEVSVNSTQFSEDGLIKVRCKLSNTGSREGKEVVQVYVGKSNSKVERAKKELKGFSKVFLDKGDSTYVTVEFKVADLAFYNESISNWEVEKGEYVISVGNSSDHITETLNIQIN